MSSASPRAPELLPIEGTRRRVRAVRAGRAAIVASLYAFSGLVAVTLLAKLSILPSSSARALGLALASIPCVAALAGALRRVSPLDAARRLDAHHALDDRLSIALQFLALPEGERTAWTEAAVDDALARAREGLDPKGAVPWRWPEASRGALAMAAVLALVAAVRIPTPREPLQGVAPVAAVRRDPLVLEDDDLRAFREMARDLERDARTPEARRAVGDFQRFLDDVAGRRLDREEAFRRLAALQQRLDASDDADRAIDAQAMRQVADEMERADATRALSDALRRGDAAAASQSMRALAEQLRQQRAMTQAQREQLARALAPRPQGRDEAELRRQVEQARREVEEMLRRQRERALSSQEQDLLRRRQREQQSREQQLQQREESRRRAEHLQRELSQAARDMLRDLQQAAQDLDRGAEQLSQMQDEQQGRMSMQELRQRLEELREQMRQQNGQNGQQQRLRLARFSRAANGQRGQGQQGQGQQGQGSQGQGSQGGEALVPGQGGNGPRQGVAIVPGSAGGIPIPVPGGAQPASGQGGREEPGSGSAAGSQHDENSRGSAVDLSGRTRTLAVAGQQTGNGPSRSQVIRSAAADGFANAPYRRVYSPYWDRAREVLHQGEVPPGYRSYVRRYFQLIRPREE